MIMENKDDELMGKARALAPKPKRKKKAGAALSPGGEQAQPGTTQPPTGKRSQPPQLAAAKDRAGRPKKTELDEKYLEQLQGSLSKLSKKALKKLNALLDDPNARVQMQAALGTIRSTVQALTRDTSTPGGGAEIHIHTSQAVAVVNPASPGSAGAAPNPHDKMQRQKAIGHPIAIVK
jgi:hypothetical protein